MVVTQPLNPGVGRPLVPSAGQREPVCSRTCVSQLSEPSPDPSGESLWYFTIHLILLSCCSYSRTFLQSTRCVCPLHSETKKKKPRQTLPISRSPLLYFTRFLDQNIEHHTQTQDVLPCDLKQLKLLLKG